MPAYTTSVLSARCRVADRDQMHVFGNNVVERSRLRGPRTVQRVYHWWRTPEHGAADRSDDSSVVVHDVEAVDLHVRGERVVSVVPRVSELSRVGWLRHWGDEVRLCARSAAREQGDFVAGVDEPVGEQRDHEFDAAVSRRRNRKPHGRDHGDTHTARRLQRGEFSDTARDPAAPARRGRVERSVRWREDLPLIGLTLFGAALRFGVLRQQSFWFDEAATIDLVHKSFSGMVKAIPNEESTPPLYYVLAWGWAKAFGTGEFGLRSLSALFGTATVPAAYAAAWIFVSRRAGLFVAAIVACSPLLVWYSQEARGYALLALLSVFSVYAFGRALQEAVTRWFAIWAVAACLALGTHYFAVFLIGAEAVWLVCAHVRHRAAWFAVAATALFAAALLPLALHQNGEDRTDWITGRPIRGRIRETLQQFVTGQYTPRHHVAVLAALLAAALAVGALLWLAEARQRRGAAVVLALGIAALLAPLALVPTSFDKFYYRNLIGAFVDSAIGFGCAFASRRAPVSVSSSSPSCA